MKSGSCGCNTLPALPALQNPVSLLELWGAGGPGSARLCGVRGAPQCEVGGPCLLGVCPARDGSVLLLGLLSGRREGGKEGRCVGGSVLFFTPCSSPMQGPRCLDGTPAARLWAQRASTKLPPPAALAADPGEAPVPCVLSDGLLWLCLGCACAVLPTPDLPVSPCHTSRRRWAAGVACAGGRQSWECRGMAVQLGCGWPQPLPKCWSLEECQVCDGSESSHQLLHWQLKEWPVWE